MQGYGVAHDRDGQTYLYAVQSRENETAKKKSVYIQFIERALSVIGCIASRNRMVMNIELQEM
jgi:hypothetical protein